MTQDTFSKSGHFFVRARLMCVEGISFVGHSLLERSFAALRMTGEKSVREEKSERHTSHLSPLTSHCLSRFIAVRAPCVRRMQEDQRIARQLFHRHPHHIARAKQPRLRVPHLT